MNDLVNLVQIVLVLAATALPIAGAIRLLAGGEDQHASTTPSRLPWPRGVQEDEPQPWRIRPALG